MNLVQRILKEIRSGENIDLYSAVLLSFGLSIASVLGLPVGGFLEPVILAVLALLAISSLVSRHQIEDRFQRFNQEKVLNLGDRKTFPSLEERGMSASEIIVTGISLLSILQSYQDFWEEKMKAGCTLRFLLVDPQSPVLKMYDLTAVIANTQTDIEQSLKILQHFLAIQKETKGSCRVKLANSYLPFGISAYDASKPDGKMYVELLAYKQHVGTRPHFQLTRDKDTKWFEYFQQQYELLWNDSLDWNGISTNR